MSLKPRHSTSLARFHLGASRHTSDRARDRFRQSGAKSDPFDARVLADFLRTDHAHLRPLQPSSEAAQELKLLTEDRPMWGALRRG